MLDIDHTCQANDEFVHGMHQLVRFEYNYSAHYSPGEDIYFRTESHKNIRPFITVMGEVGGLTCAVEVKAVPDLLEMSDVISSERKISCQLALQERSGESSIISKTACIGDI